MKSDQLIYSGIVMEVPEVSLPMVQTPTSSVNVLNETRQARWCLPSIVCFFPSLSSHCSHIRFTWVARCHLSLRCRWGTRGQRVRPTSALPLHLSSCPSSVLPSTISGSGIIECHFPSPEVMQQRWYLTEHSARCCCHSNRENLGNV